MKKYLQNKKIYFINILIILSIFIITLIANKISPFGNNILSKSDNIVIFKPMLFDFITKLKNGTLLSYSFNNGLGHPTVFNYVYCLSSPLKMKPVSLDSSALIAAIAPSSGLWMRV